MNEKHKMFTTRIKSIDTTVIVVTTSNSSTISVMGNELSAVPISASTACGLSIGNQAIYEIAMQKYGKYKKQYQKGHQTVKMFD